MNIAVVCGLIILVLLVVMLLAGVPIAVAWQCHPSVPFFRYSIREQPCLQGHREFFQAYPYSASCHSVFHPGRKYHE